MALCATWTGLCRDFFLCLSGFVIEALMQLDFRGRVLHTQPQCVDLTHAVTLC